MLRNRISSLQFWQQKIDNITLISSLIGPVENSLLLNNVKKYEAKMKKMMTEKKIKTIEEV